MSNKQNINPQNKPSHIAIIMDGNGRWAKQKGKMRIFGHKNGVKAVREVTEGCAELGIDYLTLYAFSTENWNRPQQEVSGLMDLLTSTIKSETKTLLENNVRLQVIGDIDKLPKQVAEKLKESIDKTANNKGLTLVLALSYSSKYEIIEATKKIAEDVKLGKLNVEEINESIYNNYLFTKQMPNPDLLIRTGGEKRVSNFLLWQIAYSELYFTDVFWPDFTKENLYDAIVEFQNRERRFGKTSEQVTKQ